MVEHLTHIMLIEMVRIYLKSEQVQPLRGWLAALADAKIGAALVAMHSAPMQQWMLDELAGSAGMSRSAFSLRFKTLVGTSPLDYLLRWRMRLAGRALSQSRASVSSIGLAHGYDSETAFSAAFKRVIGLSPSAYRSGNA
jgi:transcriptional regulator GlxA family with amidase domain